ncbi:hypothetical protein [Gemmatimonas groenlandica]|uniref:Uncharacterized protein n=1 Tax=Gemmatimonas groenlandica TaxID=2732249 RepID=A0A6M4IQN8_9BACT|nr:hypothetical protein [Gemmatimonas groenlandica]QJR37033.1 hypothetical protein HKW67_16665 [Gemmatimonas groenlandica]
MPTSLLTPVPSRAPRDRFIAVAALVVLGLVAPWQPMSAQPRLSAARPQQALAGAWSLPDAESLVSKAIYRIISQDRPAGVPIAEYSAKRFGRAATSEAVRQYNGQTLATIAFAPIADWPETRALDIDPCPAVGGVGCATPTGVWVAITRIERGELPHEINLSYTTHFTAAPALDGQLPQTNRYTFCERWLRVGGTWKYDGFVKMVPQ